MVLARLMLFAALVLARGAPRATAAETPILNVFLAAEPTGMLVSGTQLTIQANIFSTAEIVEHVHVVLGAVPGAPFTIAGVVSDGSLGETTCEPSLIAIVCDVPIRVGSPVSVVAQLDTPDLAVFLDPCHPEIVAAARAELPGRSSARTLAIPVRPAACTYLYLPIVDRAP